MRRKGRDVDREPSRVSAMSPCDYDFHADILAEVGRGEIETNDDDHLNRKGVVFYQKIADNAPRS